MTTATASLTVNLGLAWVGRLARRLWAGRVADPPFSGGAGKGTAWARTEDRRPTMADRRPTMADRRSTMADRRSTVADRPSTVADRPSTVAGGRSAVTAVRPKSERSARVEESMAPHAKRDALTGLPSRVLLRNRLERLLAQPAASTRVGLCYIGLDRFEDINDSLGHRVGDRLLIAAAHRLRRYAAPRGHLLVRVDSDKFAILMDGTKGSADALGTADQALATLAQPFRVFDLEIPVTASAGVVERSTTGATTAELLRAADIALHWAKADGKAQAKLYDHDRSMRDAARYRLAASMPAALAGGQFVLKYQPLVDLSSGLLVGVEALARWLHPHHGLLGPDSFIPLAEDSGLIVPLGFALLRQACDDAAQWGSAAHAPYVSVNLAAAQIRHPALVTTVTQALERAGIPSQRLQLEITEHSVIPNDKQCLNALCALADLGVRIVMDDFGTGYSNLACLPALPLHGIKLASPFVPTAGPKSSNIDMFLTNVVSLGHSLNLSVTAEGIETPEQAQRMHSLGCDIGQGWHFGRPMDAARIHDRVDAELSMR